MEGETHMYDVEDGFCEVYMFGMYAFLDKSGLSHESMGFKSSNYDNLPFHSCGAAGTLEGGEGKIKFHTFCYVCVFKPHSECAAGSSLP